MDVAVIFNGIYFAKFLQYPCSKIKGQVFCQGTGAHQRVQLKFEFGQRFAFIFVFILRGTAFFVDLFGEFVYGEPLSTRDSLFVSVEGVEYQ